MALFFQSQILPVKNGGGFVIGVYTAPKGTLNSDINLWFYCWQKQRDEPEFTVKAAKMHFRGKMLKFPQTKDFSERLIYWSEKKLKGVN